MHVAIKAIFAVALFGVGAVTGSAMVDPPDPVVETFEVEVPVEVKVAVTPQSCIDALDLVGEATVIFVAVLHAVKGYPTMVSDAALAGATFDADEIRRITSDMTEVNATVNQLSDHLGPLNRRIEAAVDTCRAS